MRLALNLYPNRAHLRHESHRRFQSLPPVSRTHLSLPTACPKRSPRLTTSSGKSGISSVDFRPLYMAFATFHIRDCSKSYAYRVILFRRMAQMNRQFSRDYPKQFVAYVYLIFNNRKSRFCSDQYPQIYVKKRRGGLSLKGSEGLKIPSMHRFCC